MAITVSMIEEKQFRYKMRGYDDQEVDAFLDEICDEMIEMQNEISHLHQSLRQQQAAPRPAYVPAPVSIPQATNAVPVAAAAEKPASVYQPAAFTPATFTPAPIPVPAAVEVPAPVREEKKPEPVQNEAPASSASATALLDRAQKLYDETLADARRQAERILKDAESQAAARTEKLNKEKKDLEEEISMLKAAARDYRRRFKQLMEDQNHLFDSESVLYE